MLIHEVDLGELQSAYIVPFSDLHLGDPHFDRQKFLGYRDWVQSKPNAFVTLNGDIMNTAIKSSVSDIYSETMNPRDCLKAAVSLFEPIKDKILCVVNGNHERRIYKEAGFDISELLAQQLGVYYAGDEAYLKIKVGKATGTKGNGKPIVYTMYQTHGWGGGKTAGAKVNNLSYMANIVLADIYIASHTHFMTTHTGEIGIPDIRTNKIVPTKLTFASSGAFLKRGGYAVTHGFTHAKLGSPRIRLDGTKKDVHVSI